MEEQYTKNNDDIMNKDERTYKDVVFVSVEEKNRIIQIEQETLEFMKKLPEYNYTELLTKKNFLMGLPNSIFADFIVAIITQMGIREKIEVSEYEKEISSTQLEELNTFIDKIRNTYYSEQATEYLFSKIEQRRYECQNKILEELTSHCDALNREQLKKLSAEVIARQYNNHLTTQYVNKINNQYDIVEQRELSELCDNHESKNIDELLALLEIIRERNYQEKFSLLYVHKMNDRIDYLHKRNLEAICENAAEMDRAQLKETIKRVNEVQCKAEIKQPFYHILNNRQDELDYNDLVILTKDVEKKSFEELTILYNELNTGKYNPKFIKKFLSETRMLLEKEQYSMVMSMVEDIETKDKETVLAIRRKVNETGFAARILKMPINKIEDRLFELDMMTLMDIHNDFDALDREGIEELLEKAGQAGVSDRSRIIYTERVMHRALNYALEETSPYAFLFQGLLSKYGLAFDNIILSTQLPAYINALNQFRNDYAVNDFYEIPIFIMTGGGYFALTTKHCYFRTDSGLVKVPLSEIIAFFNVKKMLFEGLAVKLQNGNSLFVKGIINKKILAMYVQCLNEYMTYISNQAIIGQYQKVKLHTDNFNKEAYSIQEKIYRLSVQEAVDEFVSELSGNMRLECKPSPNIFYLGNEKWISEEHKVLQNYGIYEDNKLVFIYDGSFLNSGKEGFAISRNKVYIKNQSQPLIVLTMDKIFSVETDAGMTNIIFYTNDNYAYSCPISFHEPEIATALKTKIDQYIKEMQIIYFVYGNEDVVQNQAMEDQNNQLRKNNFCMQCGNKLDVGARFCAKCGAKVQ